MRKTALLMILAAASAAAGDIVTVGRLPYPNVTVSDCKEGRIYFRTRAREVAEPLERVTAIEMPLIRHLTDAEKLRQRRPEQAVPLYDRAYEAGRIDWQRRLIRYRRLEVLGQTGMINRWVEDWAALLAENTEAGPASELRPRNWGKPAEGKQAARRLAALMHRLTDARAQVAAKAVLRELNSRAGLEEPAPPGNGNGQKPPAPGGNGERPPSGIPSAAKVGTRSRGQLRTVESMLAGGQSERALNTIDELLPKVGAQDLDRALFLAGAARLAVGRERSDSALLAQAAAMFMVSAVQYPTSPDAAEAWFRAGEISASLGDAAGAAAALRRVSSDPAYKDSPFAGQAKQRLESLAKQGTPEADGGGG